MAYNVEVGNPNCEPDDENTDQDGVFSLISLDDFYDLLMEQQEQM